MALLSMVCITIGTSQFGQHDHRDVLALVSMTTTTIVEPMFVRVSSSPKRVSMAPISMVSMTIGTT